MNKKSYRAKKADAKWDYTSDQEEAAGIRARQQRERERGGEGRIFPPMSPPQLPNRPSAKEIAEFKSQVRVAFTALKYMRGHMDKYSEMFSAPLMEEIKNAVHSCEYALSRLSK